MTYQEQFFRLMLYSAYVGGGLVVGAVICRIILSMFQPLEDYMVEREVRKMEEDTFDESEEEE